jgi:hypothetical protein
MTPSVTTRSDTLRRMDDPVSPLARSIRSAHFWKIGRYRFGIWRMISAIAVPYASPA